MNWELLSEKLSKNNKTVIIFHDKDDTDDTWLALRIQSYKDRDIPVITRYAKAKPNKS